MCAKAFGIETYSLDGDVRHFEPFKRLDQIRDKVGPGAVLTKIEAAFVRSDGTMDLEAEYTPAPTVTYTFVVPMADPPDNAPPVGAGRGPNDKWFKRVRVECGSIGKRQTVSRSNGGSTTKFSFTNEGMTIERKDPESGQIPPAVDAPKLLCSDLWSMAIRKGAPNDAVAMISYDQQGYNFHITGSVHFSLDLAGKPR
jgi:hypothetical protein